MGINQMYINFIAVLKIKRIKKNEYNIFLMLHPPFTNKIYVSKIMFLSLLGFVLAIAFSAVNTVWSVYLRQFVESDSAVGFIASFFAFIAFLGYFFVMPYIARNNKMEIFRGSMILLFLCFVAFYFINGFFLLLAVGILFYLGSVFRSVSYGILIRNMSKTQELGKNESMNYSFLNLGFVIGPLFAGFVMSKYLPKLVFLVFSFFILIAIVFSFHLKSTEIHRKSRPNSNLFINIKEYFEDINRLKIYLIGMGLSIWWAMIYVYLPLFILRNNLGLEWVGYTLFGVAVPLIFFEYFFGKRADKTGSKLFFILGFGLLGIFG